MADKVAELQATWETLAESDPLWAILSDPSKVGNRWNESEFFKTGEGEVDTVIAYLRTIGRDMPTAGPVLDFGCGVGRLSRALARHVRPVVGVDISQRMVERARQYSGPDVGCEFVCNGVPQLPFPDGHFTFIYSSVVLQHIPRPIVDEYVSEFVRTLAPGGLAVFQTFDADKGAPPPTVADRWRQLKVRLALRTRARRVMAVLTRTGLVATAPVDATYTMNVLPEADVRRLLDAAGGTVLDVRCTNSTDADFNGTLRYLDREPSYGLVSKQYAVTKLPVRADAVRDGK